ncbi:hypothetical protein ACWDSL_03805 [Streptomyces sp. NPDC000941]
MAAELRSRPGGEHIRLTIGDFTEVPVDGSYSLIYLAGGTFFEIPSQEAQLRCFEAAARHLTPGGVFVFDALLPETLSASQSAAGRVLPTSDGSLVVRHRQVDRAAQRYESHYLIADGQELNHLHVRFRYAGFGELDLMAAVRTTSRSTSTPTCSDRARGRTATVWLQIIEVGTALVLLALFVLWGVRRAPHRPFAWGMYSGSSKGYLWTPDGPDGRRRPVRHHELGLAPDSTLLTVHELNRLLRATPPPLTFDGLIVGSAGNWRVRYDGGGPDNRLYAARLTPGTGHARLIAALKELR